MYKRIIGIKFLRLNILFVYAYNINVFIVHYLTFANKNGIINIEVNALACGWCE